MKFNLLCLFAILLALRPASFAQITSTESFDPVTFPPTGWSIKVDIGANNVWVRQTNGTNPTVTPHSGAGLARYRSRSVAAGTKQILITRPIDYTNRGTSAANLDFWMFRDSLLPANQDSLTVWVNSTDTINGTAVKLGTIVRNRSIAIPDTQAVNGWYHYSYSIPASFGGTTTRFIFEGTGQSAVTGQGANIFIDDISFAEFPPICSGTPNVGNIVNAFPLICGGGGAASLSLSSPISGLLGITYAWQSAASASGPWTAIGGNTSTLAIPSITSTTFYHCVVSCSYSGLNYTTPDDSIVISANVPPVVTITPATAVYCAGTTGAQLVASGAASYAWTPVAGLNSTTNDTVLASPTATTQYIVAGSDSAGCKGYDTATVTFNAGPTVAITATPGDSICKGGQVILTSTPTAVPGNTYLWSDGKTTRRDTLIVSSSASYSVVVTNTAGCSKADTLNIVAIDSTIANFGFNQSGSFIQLHDSSIGATSWLWNFGDGNGSFSQNPLYTYSAAGSYTITLVATGPCNDDTLTRVITVLPEGMENLAANGNVFVYPNPAGANLHISLGDKLIEKVSLCNLLGQNIQTIENKSREKALTVSLAQLPSGIYIARITADGRTIPVRFTKQ